MLHPNLDEHWLWEASQRVSKSGATGVDGQSHADYEESKAQRLKDLLRKAKDGSYLAPPVKRAYIPKDGGETREIGIPAFEDKILQRAVVMLLEPIYEGEFYDFPFDFLGFTHYWGKSRKGNNVVHRKTSAKRFRHSLKAIKEWGWEHRHMSLKEQQEQINRKLSGHYGYYGITGNIRSLSRLRQEVQKHWRKWLGRRTRGGPMNWNRFKGLLANYPLIHPKIVHSYKTPSEIMI